MIKDSCEIHLYAILLKIANAKDSVKRVSDINLQIFKFLGCDLKCRKEAYSWTTASFSNKLFAIKSEVQFFPVGHTFVSDNQNLNFGIRWYYSSDLIVNN